MHRSKSKASIWPLNHLLTGMCVHLGRNGSIFWEVRQLHNFTWQFSKFPSFGLDVPWGLFCFDCHSTAGHGYSLTAPKIIMTMLRKEILVKFISQCFLRLRALRLKQLCIFLHGADFSSINTSIQLTFQFFSHNQFILFLAQVVTQSNQIAYVRYPSPSKRCSESFQMALMWLKQQNKQ